MPSSGIWGAGRAALEPTTASAFRWKRARSWKDDTVSLIGRKTASSPVWKEGEGHENGTTEVRKTRNERRKKKKRFTIDDHERGERKTSHQGKATDDEQEEHYVRTCQKMRGGGGRAILLTKCEYDVEDFFASQFGRYGIGGGGGS